MSEVAGQERAPEGLQHRDHEHGPAKHRVFARLADPMFSSIPTLVGALVGALIGHFAEVQKTNFEHEEKFRQEQIGRVAKVSHSFDDLNDTLIPMIAVLESRLPDICRRAATAGQLEKLMITAGLLRTPFFSAKGGNSDAGAYERELATLAGGATSAAKVAPALQSLYADYTAMVGKIAVDQKQFGDRREAFQATLVFEVNVYFPPQLRRDVSNTVRAYEGIDAEALAGAQLATACKLKPGALLDRLEAIHTRSSREMIGFAQSLEPEIGNTAVQR